MEAAGTRTKRVLKLIDRDSTMAKAQDAKKDNKKKPQKTSKEKKLAKKEKKSRQYE
jgi:hypothetical protein